MAPVVGGDVSADFGARECEQSGWQLVCAAKRRKNKKPAGGGLPAGKPGGKTIKKVEYAENVELYHITDNGVDEYTFDNIGDDGLPRVRQLSAPGKLLDAML